MGTHYVSQRKVVKKPVSNALIRNLIKKMEKVIADFDAFLGPKGSELFFHCQISNFWPIQMFWIILSDMWQIFKSLRIFFSFCEVASENKCSESLGCEGPGECPG